MPDPLDFSDKYNTPIPPARQREFDEYVSRETQKTGRSPLGDRFDYDVNGEFLAGAKPDERGHGSDQFKKPNHPTFSDESQYHGREGYVGGRWTTDGYEPSQTNLQFYPESELKEYFAARERGTPLLPPEPQPKPTGRNGQYRIGDFGQVPSRRMSGDYDREPTAQSRWTRTPIAIGATPETPEADTGTTFFEAPGNARPIQNPKEATRIEINPGPSASRNNRMLRHESIHALLGPYANRAAADPEVRKAAAPIARRLKQSKFPDDIPTELPAYLGAFSNDVGEATEGTTPQERQAYINAYSNALERQDPNAAARYRRMLKDSSPETQAGQNQIGIRAPEEPLSGPGKSGRFGQPRKYVMDH